MISSLHASVLSTAFEKVLSKAEQGAISFVTCLSPATVEYLAKDHEFSPDGWLVLRVADGDKGERSISAGDAITMRNTKPDPILLLVDTSRAGAGMSGIYNAAKEIDESTLFEAAIPLALEALETNMPGSGSGELNLSRNSIS